jgi:carbamoyltransferase
MANILGLHYGHDGSACVVVDGKLVSAISSERLVKPEDFSPEVVSHPDFRIKKFTGVTDKVIEYVLEKANIGYDDIDFIALSHYYEDDSYDTLKLYSGTVANNRKISKISPCKLVGDQTKLIGVIKGRSIPTYVLPHHLCHAASAYYTSNQESAVCFTLDSSGGDYECNNLVAIGNGNKLETKEFPGLMIGNGYTEFTHALGLGQAFLSAGKTMGLASYGEPNDLLIDHIDEYVKDSYKPKFFREHFENLFWQWSDGLYDQENLYKTKKGMHLAASIQLLFEKSIIDAINKFVKPIGIKNLCLSGGSFLNCNVNALIKKDGFFDNIHLYPACGDDGLSVGAALYVSHHILDEDRYTYTFSDLAYLGSPSKELSDEDYTILASALNSGDIIAWYSGQSEFGPRALGHRSLLADPRSYHNREKLNFLVKNREWFRPFAPVVLEEEAHNWFEPGDPSKYMLFTQKVLQPEKVPAITHVDGTARMQTINEKDNPGYYKLVKRFYEVTGVPMLINTSFNGNGQPIVETKDDALSLFYNNEAIDLLVIDGEIFRK